MHVMFAFALQMSHLKNINSFGVNVQSERTRWLCCASVNRFRPERILRSWRLYRFSSILCFIVTRCRSWRWFYFPWSCMKRCRRWSRLPYLHTSMRNLSSLLSPNIWSWADRRGHAKVWTALVFHQSEPLVHLNFENCFLNKLWYLYVNYFWKIYDDIEIASTVWYYFFVVTSLSVIDS